MDAEILLSDNVEALRRLAESGVRAALVYGDPPFHTGRRFFFRDRATGEESFAFSDEWPSLSAYLADLRVRLTACRDVLLPGGSLVLHVSSRLAYDVKPALDSVFGPECFEGHVVWRYRHWPTRRARPGFEDVHDVLLRYCRDPDARPRWTQLYEPLAPSTLATFGRGRQRAVFEDGRRTRSETASEVSPGVPLGNVWEVPIVAPSGKERTGYPTQKPERLLELVVGSLTEQGDLVIDPWCGSGTTIVVAARTGRRGVGIDSSPMAVAVSRRRLSP